MRNLLMISMGGILSACSGEVLEDEAPPFLGNMSTVMTNGTVVQSLRQDINLHGGEVEAGPGDTEAQVLTFDGDLRLTCDENGQIRHDFELQASYGPVTEDIVRVEIRAYLAENEGLVSGSRVIPIELGHVGRPNSFPEDQTCALNNIEPHVVDSWNRNCGALYGGEESISETYNMRIYADCLEPDRVFDATMVFDFIVYRMVGGQVPNLVVNGGFEEPALASGNRRTWALLTAIPGWIPVEHETYGPIELDRNGVGTTPNPVEGAQAMELDSHTRRGLNRTANARVRQNLNTEAGFTYELSFASSPRKKRRSNSPDDTNDFEVWWNDQQLNLADAEVEQLTDPVTSKNNWKRYTFRGLTTNESVTPVEFRGAGHEDTYGAAIDDVRVYPESHCSDG